MELISLECPQCGASLPPREIGRNMKCDYCGSRFKARESPVAKTQAGAAIDRQALERMLSQVQPHLQVQPRKVKGAGCIVLIAVLVPLIFGILPVLIFAVPGFEEAFEEIGVEVSPSGSDQKSRTRTRTETEKIHWDHIGGPPAPAKIKGQRGFIGRLNNQTKKSLFIGAYRAKDAKLIWQYGPLGDRSEASQATRFGVLGKRVVVTDRKNRVNLLDLDTGKRRDRHKLSDRAARVCTPPDGKGHHVWIEVVDKQHQRIDVKTGKMARADALPNWCKNTRLHGSPFALRQQLRDAPKVESFQARRILTEGDLGVIAGVKHPGTPFPRAVGFDPKKRTLRWNKALLGSSDDVVGRAEHFDALVDGRYTALVAAGRDKWRLMAYDARSGERQWKKSLPAVAAFAGVEGVSATSRHIFVVRSLTLEIYDARKGKRLGIVGDSRFYE